MGSGGRASSPPMLASAATNSYLGLPQIKIIHSRTTPRMTTSERQLRLLQIGCILVILASIKVSLMIHRVPRGRGLVQGVVIVLALSSAVQGFTLQRKIVNGQSQRRSKSSTPFGRWKAGNLVRLAFATAVGLWGLVLRENGGPLWLVDGLFALGVILLLIWSPGVGPDPSRTDDP